MPVQKPPLFPLGSLVMTPGAKELFVRYGVNPSQWLQRHGRGDFGCVSSTDADANRAAIQAGERIHSAYWVPGPISIHREKIWIITEADRSVTTILLPDEY